MSMFLDNTIQISLILLLALAGIRALRRQSAAARHWVLSAAILCAAATPVLHLVVPSWHLVAAVSSAPHVGQPPEPAAGQTVLPQTLSNLSDRFVAAVPVGLIRPAAGRRLVGLMWLIGVGMSLLILLIGLGRLAWVASRSRRVLNGKWAALSESISRTYGLSRSVALLQSDHPTLLVTWGLLRPKIMLPSGASEWSEDRMRVVLSHELAHIQRRDWLVQMATEIARALYWFNPFMWMACRRLRQESEHACDDVVMSLGIEGSDYAALLVDLVRSLKGNRRTWYSAPAMARASGLERRVRAMLNAHLNRAPLPRWARVVAALAVLAMTLPIAGWGSPMHARSIAAPPVSQGGAAAAQAGSGRISGIVYDPTGAVMPDAEVSMTRLFSTDRHETRSDQAGHFVLAGLPSDDYRLQVVAFGFDPQKITVALAAGQDVQRNIALTFARAVLQLSVTDREAPPFREPENNPHMAEANEWMRSQRVQGGRPVGLPRSLPYPQILRDARIEGTVVLDGRIGTDGLLNGVRISAITIRADDLDTSHNFQPEVVDAAVRVARQWQWEPTRFDGTPIETPITLTIDFKLSR